MKAKRDQSYREELLNAISHGVALMASIATVAVFIELAMDNRDIIYRAGLMIFSTTLILLYLASAMYHALPPGRAKKIFQTLDHIAIFLLIAGTYTPFSLGILRGSWGWTLLGLIWTLALTGIILEITGRLKSGRISNSLYLAMGWSALLVVKPLINSMPFSGLFLLLTGGIFYSLGVYFYARDDRKYYHFIWHIMVVSGSVFHFFAVLKFA